jgi:uncharacterized cupredoxin-like copper-binding protein
MPGFTRALVVVAAFATSSTLVRAEGDHKAHKAGAHSHAKTFSAGELGDAKKPAKVIQVTMGEKDGKMFFAPAKLEVKKGEQVKFMLRNLGDLEHEFVLATTADNLKHAEAMKANPNMEHDESNGVELVAKASGEIVWKFTKAGDFEYACLIPGHREAGMVGVISVK